METGCLRICYFHVLQQREPPTHSEEERILLPNRTAASGWTRAGCVPTINSQVQHHLQLYGPQASLLLLLAFIHITALSEKRKLLSGTGTFDPPSIDNPLKGLAPWWQKEIMH